LRLAEINDVGFAVQVKASKTEAELASAILQMDLKKEDEGWYTKKGFSIAARGLPILGSQKAIEASDMVIYTYKYGPGSDDLEVEEAKVDEPEVTIPENTFLIADGVKFQTRRNGLVVILFGSNVVFEDEANGQLTRVSESAEAKLTSENLPVKIGIIAQDKLINIRPIVFTPGELA
jgi:hypothetical protein